jgi:hypothetical protein
MPLQALRKCLIPAWLLTPPCPPAAPAAQDQSTSGYFAGDKLSYADIHVYSGLSFLASGFFDGERWALAGWCSEAPAGGNHDGNRRGLVA